MNKRWLALAVMALSSLGWGQKIAQDTCTVGASGGTCIFQNTQGGVTATFEETFTGTPATVSVTIQGCMRGGTCDTAADTYTTATASNRNPAFSTVYDYFKITASWTGGSSPTTKVNMSTTIARRGGGGGTLHGNGAPAGTPASLGALYTNDLTGDLYANNAGAWLLIGPGAAGSAAFNTLTSGTASGKAFVIGAGSSLDFSSGTINASHLGGTAAASFVQTSRTVNAKALSSNITLSLATDFGATIAPVANGGNGTATPALVAGTNVTLSGTWPNITINASSSGGGLFTAANNASAIAGNKAVSGTCTGKVNASDLWELDCPLKLPGSPLLLGAEGTIPSTPGTAGDVAIGLQTTNGAVSVNSAGLAKYMTQVGACTNQVFTAFLATGAHTCTTLTSAYVNNTIAQTGVDINTSFQVTALHMAAAIPVNQGGTGLATLTAHAVQVGAGTSNVVQVGPDASTTKFLASAGVSADPGYRSIATGDLPAALASQTSVNGTTIPSSATLTQTIASGTSAMGTSAISSGTCASAVTTTATGTATTDVIVATPNADPTGVTGYAVSATGSLYIQAYPTANNVNFKVCNNTSGSLTPSALTLNWKVVR